MSRDLYDIITVGGGLSGSAFAKAMAERGKRVLVIEREPAFKDRVRGEYLSPWGVAEAQKLGIHELIRDQSGIDAPAVDMGVGPRDLPSTTPQKLPALGFSHPEMQETLLRAAKAAGAEVRRGTVVTALTPGTTPSVTAQNMGGTEELKARLVVTADGRTSVARKWAGFTVREEPQPYFFAGLLLADVAAPPGQAYLLFNPPTGMATAITPVGKGRHRTYVAYPESANYRLQGSENVPRFIEEAKKAKTVSGFFDSARAIGPLASFRCGDFCVDHPYQQGVVLIGDAAATTDPAFGQGLSLTLRDVRVLRDKLSESADWDAACHAYATEHDRYVAAESTVEKWFRKIFMEQSPEADSIRARALPLLAEDHNRAPDHLLSGPDLPWDDSVRKRFFGEA